MKETPPCQGCGSLEPTARVCFRQNVGKVVMLHLGKKQGPYCWRCGHRWFASMTKTTLLKGWWSPQSLVIAPWCLASNVWNLRKLWKGTGGPDRRIARWKIATALLVLVGLVAAVAEGAACWNTSVPSRSSGHERVWGVPLTPYRKPSSADPPRGLVTDPKCGWLPQAGPADHGDGPRRVLLLGGTAAAAGPRDEPPSLAATLATATGTTVVDAAVFGHGLDQTYLHALSVLADIEGHAGPDAVVLVLQPGALIACGRILPPSGPPVGSVWQLPFGKPRFVPKDEHSLSLVNVPAPQAMDPLSDAEALARWDLLYVPGTFEEGASPSQFLRWWTSRTALDAGREPIRQLRAGEPCELAAVADRLLGMLLGSAGANPIVVFVPDLEALTETDWWTALIRPRAEPAGATYVDLTPELIRVGSARSLAPDFFLAPGNRGLSAAGVEVVAELLSAPVREALDGR